MPLPRKLLTEGESVVIELRQTWLVLAWPLFFSVCAAALAIAVVIAVPKAPIAVGYLLLAILAVALSWLGFRWLKWRSTAIVLTTARILERRGILSRSGVEIRLDRINELSYRQKLLERIVRTGTLVVECGGETGVVTYDYLPQPGAVQSLVNEQIDSLRRAKLPWPQNPTVPQNPAVTPQAGYPLQGAYPPQAPNVPPPPPPAPGGPTVADRLVQLDELRQRGILTDAEFQQKKVELLRLL
jgi:hypothetical protein